MNVFVIECLTQYNDYRAVFVEPDFTFHESSTVNCLVVSDKETFLGKINLDSIMKVDEVHYDFCLIDDCPEELSECADVYTPFKADIINDEFFKRYKLIIT